MKIAIDKDSFKKIKKDSNEYIYLYDDESLEELIKKDIHCIYYKYCDYVDINLTDYKINCIKEAKITDKDWYKLPEKVDYKIGIIIPNYNYEHTLRKCLNSILKQTYNNYEIILVDDMSTDNSLKIEREFASTYPRIKLVELKQKRYNGGARNEAYLHLSDDVDYIYYVDSDDWLYDKDALLNINRKLQSKPDVLFVEIMEYKNGKTKVMLLLSFFMNYEFIIE